MSKKACLLLPPFEKGRNFVRECIMESNNGCQRGVIEGVSPAVEIGNCWRRRGKA
jgi:hypothetical protein